MGDITTERVLTYAFGAGVVIVATGLAWSKLLTGAEWVTLATWVTGAVILGRAAGIAASGFVVSTVSKVQNGKVDQ